MSGTILVNKAPADKAQISLVPATLEAQKENWPNGYPSAESDAEGNFKIGTYAKGDGAPAGNYVVIVRWNEGSGDDVKDRLKGAYFNPKKSKHTVEVKADMPPIKLELSN